MRRLCSLYSETAIFYSVNVRLCEHYIFVYMLSLSLTIFATYL